MSTDGKLGFFYNKKLHLANRIKAKIKFIHLPTYHYQGSAQSFLYARPLWKFFSIQMPSLNPYGFQ
jgi:hypothetical protein